MLGHEIFLLALAWVASAQNPSPLSEFEAASIKPAQKLTMAMMNSGQMHFRRDNAAFEESNASLLGLIAIAFHIDGNRVSGPAWMNDQYFAVAAKLPSGSTKEQIPAMMQKLLADRFKLAVHHDQKVESVYLLVAGKQELKPKQSAGDADPNTKGCSGRPGQYSCRQFTLAELAGSLSAMATAFNSMPMPVGTDGETPRNINLPVVDQTGLTGLYDIDLQWVPPAGLEGGRRAGRGADLFPPRDPSVKATSIFGAIEAAGLKLQPGKHAFDILVIDHVERAPTEN